MEIDFTTLIILLGTALVFYLIGRLAAELTFKKREKEARRDAVQKSRSVLTGKFSEQLAPLLPDFPYNPAEAKFLGSPIDLIVFEGLDEKKVRAVRFIEVKSGKASLSTVERTVRDSINNGNVSWEEYRTKNG